MKLLHVFFFLFVLGGYYLTCNLTAYLLNSLTSSNNSATGKLFITGHLSPYMPNYLK